MNDHTVDRILALLAVCLAPFASLVGAKFINKREREHAEHASDSGTAVDVFQAHLAAFQLRIEGLEHEAKILQEENTLLCDQVENANARIVALDKQNGDLLRENYHLRHDLDDCLHGRSRP